MGRRGARVAQRGGECPSGHRVVGIERTDRSITAVKCRDENTGEVRTRRLRLLDFDHADQDSRRCLKPEDGQVARIAAALPYRDFMTAGLLVRRMTLPRIGGRDIANGMPPDNWIYIQEPDVKLGRLQVFNNWSPALVADPATIWLGLGILLARR